MKSASLLLIAVVLVAATAASAADIRTRVEGGKCRRQVSEQEEKLEHCKQYMRSAIAMQRGRGEEVELREACGVGCEMGNEDCCARECCRALERMDDDCACQTVKALAQQATSTRGMRTAARQLANRCGISQQCDVRAVFV